MSRNFDYSLTLNKSSTPTASPSRWKGINWVESTDKKNIELLKALIALWNRGEISDGAAMMVAAWLVYPPKISPEQLERARRYAEEHDLDRLARELMTK